MENNNIPDIRYCADEGKNCECNGTVFYGKRHKDPRRLEEEKDKHLVIC